MTTTTRSADGYDRNRWASQPKVKAILATNTTAAVSKIGNGAVSSGVITRR